MKRHRKVVENLLGAIVLFASLGGAVVVFSTGAYPKEVDRTEPASNQDHRVSLRAGEIRSVASPPAPPASRADAEARHSASGLPSATGGMVVGVDPESGQLGMPTPEQMLELSEAWEEATQFAPRPLPVQHADGSMSLETRSWMREFYIHHSGAHGHDGVRCVSGVGGAHAALDAPQSLPTGLEER